MQRRTANKIQREAKRRDAGNVKTKTTAERRQRKGRREGNICDQTDRREIMAK